MKILYGFIVVLLIGGLIFFFNQNDSTETEQQLTEIQKIQKDKPKRLVKNPSQKIVENEKVEDNPIETQNNQTGEKKQNIDRYTDEEFQELDYDEQEELIDDTPEYSEEVSSEDFKEFIGIALEELDSGDELAEAIITEMFKIAQAQPDHLDQVRGFYRTCSNKNEISSDNQELCIKFLEKINEQ